MRAYCLRKRSRHGGSERHARGKTYQTLSDAGFLSPSKHKAGEKPQCYGFIRVLSNPSLDFGRVGWEPVITNAHVEETLRIMRAAM
jgi:hypothetical protein